MIPDLIFICDPFPDFIIEKGIMVWEIMLWLGRSKFCCFFKHFILCKSCFLCDIRFIPIMYICRFNLDLTFLWIFNTPNEIAAKTVSVYFFEFHINCLSATSPGLLNCCLILLKIHEALKWIWPNFVLTVTLNRNSLTC